MPLPRDREDVPDLSMRFEITSEFEKRLGIPLFGQGGKSIYDQWRDGMRSAYGVMCTDFQTC